MRVLHIYINALEEKKIEVYIRNIQLKNIQLPHISLLLVILRGLHPPPRDVTGDRGCVAPGKIQPGTTVPTPPTVFF